MNIKELRGLAIKKGINCDRAIMRYHNKNLSGGNFGFTIIYKKEGLKDVGCGHKMPNSTWFDMHGAYDTTGLIHWLRFSQFAKAGSPVPINSMESLFEKMKEIVKMEDSELTERLI